MRPVPERLAAKAAGQATYNTGKSCKNGHLSDRRTSTGNCIVCDREKAKRFLARGGTPPHPNRIIAQAAGERHYSGQPCPKGHDKRWVKNGNCVACGVARAKKWVTANPGYEAAAARRRRAADPTGHRAEVKRWKEKNREKAAELLREWKRNNPERAKALARVGAANRRARVRKNGGSFTIKDIETLYARQRGRCAVCPQTEGLEIDHILPVLLGGSNHPSNLQLLCLPCNRTKGSKHPDAWRAELAIKSPDLPL